MTFSLAIPPRDQEALDAARASGDLPQVSAEMVSELSPKQAVMLGLARHLGSLEARVESDSGPATRLAFKTIRDTWPTGTEPADYPSAAILPQVTTEWDAVTVAPVRTGGEDVVTDDGAWALWNVGEDVGTAIVHVFASYEAHRDALCAAVEQALFGSLNRLSGLALPIPEDYLPPPFRGFFSVENRPKARVSFETGGGPVDDNLAGAGGVWRGDVYFRWQVVRYAARPRLPDLRTETNVRVGPPGEEI